jgi:hypothetical protein
VRCGVLASKGQAKGKAIPVTGRAGPYGCETSRLPHFSRKSTYSGEVVNLTRRPFFTPRKIRGLVYSKAIVRLEGLVQYKNPVFSS